MKSLKNFLLHLSIFVIVELIFVLIIFRELPEMSLLTLIGVLHTSYWLMVLGAGIVREKYAHSIRQKFLCTYIPVLYHVFIHIYAGRETVHEMEEATHDHHSIQWLLIGTMAAGILIVLGEYWLHRTTHCMTHHSHAHKHCHDEECEEEHQSH